MAVVAMAQAWWPLSPWLSPGAAWFVFFNAVVAAIAVMSSSCAGQDQDRHASRMSLRRSASSAILDQLRSFSLFSVHPVAGGGVAAPALDDLGIGVPESDYYCHCSQEAENLPAPQVTDRDQASAVVAERPRPTAPVAGESVRVTVSSVASSKPDATVVKAAEPTSAPESNKDEEEADSEEEEQGKSISLDEAYTMVQQSRHWRSPPGPAAASLPTTTTTTIAASWPQKIRGDRAAKKGPKRRRPGLRGAEEAPAELNARAELFIRQFREELKLQRINSLLRHTHALGTVDGTPTPVAVS